MGTQKKDYKKEFKGISKPVLIDVPAMNFIMVDGFGTPGEAEYQAAMSALYALSWTIKMSKMGPDKPEGYFEYVVPPLEGLWYAKDKGTLDITTPKSTWYWTSMIRLPEFVTKDFYNWAAEEVGTKKPEVDLSKARFETFKEGLCVQIMHTGSYDDEIPTVEKIHKFMEENNLQQATDGRHHHEIYLNDPRKTKAENLKTVIRLPVETKK